MSVLIEPEASLTPHSGLVTRLVPAGPHLGVRWTKPRENFFSSLRAVFAGPKTPRKFNGAPYFRDCWISPRKPTLAFIAALVLEAGFLIVANPHLNLSRPRTGVTYGQLTWYMPASDPAPDLPLLSPASPTLKPRARNRGQQPAAPQPDTAPGADTFNPRQTIWSQPLKPNHPRQELLEPSAPDTPPKILPVLPNIVQWDDDDSAHPALHLSPGALRRMQPGRAANKQTDDVAAPDIANQQKAADPIDIAPSASDAGKPAMVVPAMSRGKAPSRGSQSGGGAPAPEIGPSAPSDGGRVIALSETPGPAAPPPALPQGNLRAKISASPDGRKGAPGGSNGAGGGANGAPAGSGPAGIGVSSSGNLPDAPVAAVSGPSGAGGRGSGSGAGAPRPVPRSSSSSAAKTAPAGEPPMKVALAPGAPPESLLGSNQVYTLNISMANLSSAMGNWVMKFAEFGAPEYIPDGRPRPADSGLSGPVLLRKVDPKYPPELKLEKIEGEVVLYAVIRKDGSVDSIQLVHGLNPELDQNAMEALGRWKFQPASRHGEPVELIAIVHIPFHAPPPEPVY